MSLEGPIVCAGERELPDLVDGPDMRDTVTGWSRPMLLKVVSLKAGPGGDAVETVRNVNTEGFLLPTTARKLNITEDGTRKWKYWSLFVLNDPQVTDGDKFQINETPYKVIESQDYSQFGFFKFGIREDFRS